MKRAKIKKCLKAIAKHAEARMPLITYIDPFTVNLLRDAAKAISHLEKRLRKTR